MMKYIFILFLFILKTFEEEEDCRPQNIEFHGFSRFPRRSVPFTVEVTADKCPGQDELYFTWGMRKLPEGTVLGMSFESSIEIGGYALHADMAYSSRFENLIIK